jgi:hypothetical protein
MPETLVERDRRVGDISAEHYLRMVSIGDGLCVNGVTRQRVDELLGLLYAAGNEHLWPRDDYDGWRATEILIADPTPAGVDAFVKERLAPPKRATPRKRGRKPKASKAPAETAKSEPTPPPEGQNTEAALLVDRDLDPYYAVLLQQAAIVEQATEGGERVSTRDAATWVLRNLLTAPAVIAADEDNRPPARAAVVLLAWAQSGRSARQEFMIKYGLRLIPPPSKKDDERKLEDDGRETERLLVEFRQRTNPVLRTGS